MPGPKGPWGASLVSAVRAGEVAESTIDDHLTRLLRLAGRVGALAGVPAERSAAFGPPLAPDAPVFRDALRSLAAAGMVLLTGQDVLPLDPTSIAEDRPLVLVGRHAVDTVLQGGGSAAVRPPYEISIADALGEALGVDRVRVEDGVNVRRHPTSAKLGLVTDPETGSPGIRITSYDAAGAEMASTTSEVADIVLGLTTGPHEGAAEVELRADLAVPAGTAMLVGVRGVGQWRFAYGEQARDVEVAVVVVGMTPEQETEAVDKSTLVLPGRQDDLVRAVAAVARRTVVVVNSATPVLMPWLDQVDAVLWVGLPGQEGGRAVADVLLGISEPTGRLVTTFPAADGDGPAWRVLPESGALPYTEATWVGYRGWDGMGTEPAFWFGAGLGWGQWDYRSATHAREGQDEVVTVTLHNRATRPSREVVQVYWRPDGPPPIRLVGWAIADEVVPNEQRSVRVQTDPQAFRLWDEKNSAWTTPSGGTLVIARGLGDIRLEIPRG